jgi:hypothetical protein
VLPTLVTSYGVKGNAHSERADRVERGDGSALRKLAPTQTFAAGAAGMVLGIHPDEAVPYGESIDAGFLDRDLDARCLGVVR